MSNLPFGLNAGYYGMPFITFIFRLARASNNNTNKSSMLAGYVNHALERDEGSMQQKTGRTISTTTRTISKESNENMSSYISYDSCFCDDESHLVSILYYKFHVVFTFSRTIFFLI